MSLCFNVNELGNWLFEANYPKEPVCGKESDFPVCLWLWITDNNNVVNDVQFLAQTDHFAS